MSNLIEAYVMLLDYDEYGDLRPTMAIDLGDGLYKLLPIENYDTADETWEFPPESIVRLEQRTFENEVYLRAVKP